jgi:hypothetical protein
MHGRKSLAGLIAGPGWWLARLLGSSGSMYDVLRTDTQYLLTE